MAGRAEYGWRCLLEGSTGHACCLTQLSVHDLSPTIQLPALPPPHLHDASVVDVDLAQNQVVDGGGDLQWVMKG